MKLKIVCGLLCLLLSGCSNSEKLETIINPITIDITMPKGLPENSYEYIPILMKELNTHWSEFSGKSYIAAQVEQETCYSLTHSKCWSPMAELKTSREYGFGFGQLTITNKFNKFEEVKELHNSLSDWEWNDRYNPQKQLRALVLLDNNIHTKVNWAANGYNRLAFTLASYNGGLQSVRNDSELCRNTENCDYTRWFENVEKTSWKSKTKLTGYGQSFYDINRGYVKNIMTERYIKYRFMD
jgi:hypothetical protein